MKSDLNAWKQLCELLKESRATENKPANELDLLLSKFFVSVRKQNGTECEPGNENDPACSEAFNATFLFGHLINILLTEPGRSVWQNLDLGRWYRPHCGRSVLARSVKILPYKPPARLIRRE